MEIISPARFVARETLSLAVGRATQAGITVVISPACYLQDGQFAGSDPARAHDFIRAWNQGGTLLWCARGGYGAGRILSLVRGQLVRGITSVIGYSDQTYLLAHIAKNRLGKAVHGPMPVDLANEAKRDAVDGLLGCILRDDFSFSWESESVLQPGDAVGPAIVGNLSVLTRLIGTPDEPDWEGAILFVEDVDEYLYAIDRMFLHLAEAGVLARIAGLVLGSFTDIHDNEVPFGRTVDDIALHYMRGRQAPVISGAPFGHGPQNRPIVFGAVASLTCADGKGEVKVKG